MMTDAEKLEALLKAVDEALDPMKGGDTMSSLQNARAAFDPPKQYEYALPEWSQRKSVAINYCEHYGIGENGWNDLRELTKREVKPEQQWNMPTWDHVEKNKDGHFEIFIGGGHPIYFDKEVVTAIRDKIMGMKK